MENRHLPQKKPARAASLPFFWPIPDATDWEKGTLLLVICGTILWAAMAWPVMLDWYICCRDILANHVWFPFKLYPIQMASRSCGEHIEVRISESHGRHAYREWYHPSRRNTSRRREWIEIADPCRFTAPLNVLGHGHTYYLHDLPKSGSSLVSALRLLECLVPCMVPHCFLWS